MTHEISIFPISGNQDTTRESTCKKEILSEINDTEELPEGDFPINLKLTDQYQRKYPSLMAKYNMDTCKTVSFVEEVIDILTL